MSVRPHDRASTLARLVPVAALLGAIVSLSVGTSFAKRLFPLVGAAGTTTYRVVGAALILGILWRPWRLTLARRDVRAIALYGVTIGVMNLLFYQSLRTLPLGIATAVEFSGPLTVAVVSSRRATDFAWIGLALVGLGLLLPLRGNASALDPTGVAFALGAAVCWALYIVFGKRLGHLHGGSSVALGLAIASLVTIPFGVLGAGEALLKPSSIALGLVVAAMSSAIPFSLEMVALKRLPKQAFGVMLSMDPAVGALAALLILGERLTPPQWLAVAFIMVASVGMALTAPPASSIVATEGPPA